MKIITCKCGSQVLKDYKESFLVGGVYYWRCSECGQEFIETAKPIINIDENKTDN